MWKVISPILLMAFLSLVAPSHYSQTSRTRPPLVTDRPVKKLPVRAPQSDDIKFTDFGFKLQSIGPHPGMFPIEGEPSMGFHYFVEATLYGSDAIATAKFEAIDEHGALIEPVPIRREPGPGGSPAFYGVMAVPDRPFRVAVTGEAIDGKRYQRVYKRLYKPIDRRPVVPPLIAQMRRRAFVSGISSTTTSL
jgi:hypothetical protein